MHMCIIIIFLVIVFIIVLFFVRVIEVRNDLHKEEERGTEVRCDSTERIEMVEMGMEEWDKYGWRLMQIESDVNFNNRVFVSYNIPSHSFFSILFLPHPLFLQLICPLHELTLVTNVWTTATHVSKYVRTLRASSASRASLSWVFKARTFREKREKKGLKEKGCREGR